MQTKSFPIGDILTVTTNTYVLLGNKSHLYEFLSFMTGEVIDQPVQISAAIEKCAQNLCEQFPYLSRQEMKAPMAELYQLLGTARGEKEPLEILDEWYIKLSEGGFGRFYDKTLLVSPLSSQCH